MDDSTIPSATARAIIAEREQRKGNELGVSMCRPWFVVIAEGCIAAVCS